MSRGRSICMLAAENDAIAGAKVGGIGDVLRDLPEALGREGAEVAVVIPAYGKFHTVDNARYAGTIDVAFSSRVESVAVFELPDQSPCNGRTWVLHHPLFESGGAGVIYCDDDADRPFATDAAKFALFAVAAATLIRDGWFGEIDIIHCHDWHSALVGLLRAADPAFEALQALPLVYSIHNLALQGVRPLQGDTSSLAHWFPHLPVDRVNIRDPRWPDCINPMAVGIRLADKVHTVSPAYADEIQLANVPAQGFHGGEGLEQDLADAASDGRLLGILNGIDYPESKGQGKKPKRPSIVRAPWKVTVRDMANTLLQSLGTDEFLRASDYLAHQRLLQLSNSRPKHVFTSVGRFTTQKMALLLTPDAAGETALERIIRMVRGKGVILLLGTGDKTLEAVCQRLASQYAECIFINRYSNRIANTLYEQGDMFLMPSSFEPCGISQMLAMREAQPCVVHAVGGLRDTVVNNKTGYTFSGNSVEDKINAFCQTVEDVIALRETSRDEFQHVALAAAAERFSWQASARRYLKELYI